MGNSRNERAQHARTHAPDTESPESVSGDRLRSRTIKIPPAFESATVASRISTRQCMKWYDVPIAHKRPLTAFTGTARNPISIYVIDWFYSTINLSVLALTMAPNVRYLSKKRIFNPKPGTFVLNYKITELIQC